MKKLRYIVLGSIASVLLSCDVRVMGSLVPVSLVELLANPQRFENKIIEVSGYLESINDLRLFLTKEHALINDVNSSVEIFDSTDGGLLIQLPCMSHYVKVTGKFSKVYKGYAYAIKDVSRIYEYDSNEFCWNTEVESPEEKKRKEEEVELIKKAIREMDVKGEKKTEENGEESRDKPR